MYILVLITIFSSCKQNQEEKLPQGFYYGGIEEYKASNKMEENLISQFNTYIDAVFSADDENILHYIWGKVIDYQQSLYPSLSKIEIENLLLTDIKKYIFKIYNQINNKEIDFNIYVTDIEQMYIIDHDIICIFFIQDQIKLNTNDEKSSSILSDKDKNIGISEDNGKTWQFLSYNKDTKDILKLYFNENFINQILTN